jgi:hypothetical protein
MTPLSSWPPSAEDFEKLADRRKKDGASTQRVWNKNHDLVGVLGEIPFGLRFGLKPDFKTKRKGDGRIDFAVFIDGVRHTVDVKATEHPKYETAMLLRQVEVPHSDILVLAQVFLSEQRVDLLGWEYDKEIIKAKTMRFGGQWDRGAENHMVYAPKLKKIGELEKLVGINPKGRCGSYYFGEPYSCELLPDFFEEPPGEIVDASYLTCADCAFGQNYKGPNPKEGFRVCIFHGKGVFGFRPACKNIMEREKKA